MQVTTLLDWHEHNNEVHQQREVHVEETASQPRVLRSNRLKMPKVSIELSMKSKAGDANKETISEVGTASDKITQQSQSKSIPSPPTLINLKLIQSNHG